MRSPQNRDERLHAVPLLVLRDSGCELTPGDDFVLARGDEMLLVGWPSARRSLETTMLVDAALEYVVSGRHVPSSWIWRRLARNSSPMLTR